MTRIAKAQDELTAFCGDGGQSELDRLLVDVTPEDTNEFCNRRIGEKCDLLRGKYDIPAGVFLFYNGCDGSHLGKHSLPQLKPFIAAFVRGRLDSDTYWDLRAFFEEFDQCDYGWILIEKPLAYYDRPALDGIDEILREIESVATRSRTKARNLPRLAGDWSKP